MKQTFEEAFGLYREISEGNADALHRLNSEVLERDLSGRAVVLALDQSDLHTASQDGCDSHFLPQGRLGGFDVLVDENDDLELVAILHDIRGNDMGAYQVALWGQEVPVDVSTELRGNSLFERIQTCITPDNPLFDELLKMIREIPQDNLSLATFASGMNDFALPGSLLSSVYAERGCVDFVRDHSSVGFSLIPTFYPVGRLDMYRLSTDGAPLETFLLLTSMAPTYWDDSYRTVLINNKMLGYDLA